MAERVYVDTGTGMGRDTRRLCIVTPFGWRIEAWVSLSRWRLAMVGLGAYLGEPWGIFEGRLWGVAIRLWSLGIGFGVRGPALVLDYDDYDESEVDAAERGR